MKAHFGCLLAVTIAVAGQPGPVAGQSAMQKMLDSLVGRKNPPPAPPSRESDARLMEILVELAWLGDPLTFPFYLEAHLEGPILQVRGNVPSPAIHEHALKLAQMNCPVPVADGLRENPRLVVRPTRMTPDQLQNVVRAALRESLPGLAKNLQTRCTADGQVAVVGNVDSFERKLAVSQALRRLHGCTVVVNLTKVAYDPDGTLARTLAHAAAQTVSATTPVPPPVVLQLPDAADGMKNNPPAAVPPAGPTDLAAAKGPRLTPVQIQKRIKDACPKALDVKVAPEANGDINVEVQVREEADCDAVVNQVYAFPDLGDYPLKLHFKVQK